MNQSGSKRKRIIAVVGIVLVVVLLILLWPVLSSISAEDILNYSPENPWLAALFLIGIFCLKNVLMLIPSAALCVAAGMMFPTGWAIALVYLALAAELSIGYFWGRRQGAERVSAFINKRPKADSFFKMIERNEKTACFLTRMIPMPVPIDLISQFFGAAKVPYPVYLIFSLLGITSITIPFVIAGKAIQNPLSAEFLVPFGISVGITGAVLVAYLLFEKWRGRSSVQAQENINEDAAA